MSKIFAVDPANVFSAYVVFDKATGQFLEHDKIENAELKSRLENRLIEFDYAVCELFSSYGLPVGRDVFDSCIFIGQLVELVYRCYGIRLNGVYRRDAKLHLTGIASSKDSNVRAALIERLAKHDFKNGKGNKQNPDTFYKFKADEWSAAAIALRYAELGPSEWKVGC